jgi:hypothetical protein
MKKASFLAIILILNMIIIGACNKPKPTTACKEGYVKAIITGYDMRKCACCGGLMVTFSNDPTPYSADFVLVETMPKGSTINESTKFPVHVCIKYEKLETSCGTVKIKVTDMVVVQ